jgi:hypothetical protein
VNLPGFYFAETQYANWAAQAAVDAQHNLEQSNAKLASAMSDVTAWSNYCQKLQQENEQLSRACDEFEDNDTALRLIIKELKAVLPKEHHLLRPTGEFASDGTFRNRLADIYDRVVDAEGRRRRGEPVAELSLIVEMAKR